MIRAGLLTTDTPHHRWFAHGLIDSGVCAIVGTAIENKPGPRQLTQEAADLSLFGNPEPIPQALRFDHIGDSASFLAALSPDVLICYGTGKVPASVFTIPPLGTVNCHGGRLPHYRGLDTNIWAALIGNPQDMAVTLHKMGDGLDEGPIYGRRQLACASLPGLLFETTALCLRMVIELMARMNIGPAPLAANTEQGLIFKAVPHDAYQIAERALR